MRAEDFLALQGSLSEAALLRRWSTVGAEEETHSGVAVRRARNSIDRLTGHTPDTGGLHFSEETWYRGKGPHLWAFADAGNLGAERLEGLLACVGSLGYGRDASTGRGQFTATVRSDDTGLFSHSGNRWMTLSRGALTENMSEPRYRLATHHGRLGGERAHSPNPFKRPMLLVVPGSTFSGAAGPHGSLLRDLHPDAPDVVENAWHLSVPFTEVQP